MKISNEWITNIKSKIFLSDVNCKTPNCVNNTLATLVNSFEPNGTATYVCERGYAFNINGDLRLTHTINCNYDDTPDIPVSTWDTFDQECASKRNKEYLHW